MGKLFTLDHIFEQYRDYEAGFNYAAVPQAAVRVTLTHNTKKDTWCLLMEQEEGEGCWDKVIERTATAEEAAQLLAVEADDRHRHLDCVLCDRPAHPTFPCDVQDLPLCERCEMPYVRDRSATYCDTCTPIIDAEMGAADDQAARAAALVAALETIRNEITLTDAELDATNTIQRKVETRRIG